MGKSHPIGRKEFFLHIVGTTPILIVGAQARDACAMSNEGNSTLIRVGLSGTVGIGIPAGQGLSDTVSADEYWAWTDSGSGTISGFVVRT